MCHIVHAYVQPVDAEMRGMGRRSPLARGVRQRSANSQKIQRVLTSVQSPCYLFITPKGGERMQKTELKTRGNIYMQTVAHLLGFDVGFI